MEFGVSIASLYPQETEKAFRELAELGITNLEIFFNAMSELDGSVFREILEVQKQYSVKVTSVHPFQSAFETMYLFSGYKRRTDEAFEVYKRYFDAMNRLGAKIFILHGALGSVPLQREQYAERLYELILLAESFGIIIGQENVAYCKSGKLDFIKYLIDNIKEVRFVVDMKQTARAGYDLDEMLDTVGGRLVHIHASDNNADHCCLKIGEGDFDFARLMKRLKNDGYHGRVMLELYRDNFHDKYDLLEGVRRLEKY